jgi:hypothetical protein
MKDPLDYSDEELKQLSKEELNELAAQCDNLESLYNTSQLVQKLLINSLYGAIANKYFPLYNQKIAAAITGNGRYFIQKLANYIENELQRLLPSQSKYIIYGDTDSVYYNIKPFMEKVIEQQPDKTIDEYTTIADDLEKKIIQPVIQKTINDFAEELNAFNKDVIGAEREVIADSGVFTAKKKYYLRVRDSEGTRFPSDNPYIKVMGLEIVRSSTPKWCQAKLKEAIPKILDSDEETIKNWVKELKEEFRTIDLVQISQVSGVSNMAYDLMRDKGIPIGSRSSLVHNKYIEDNNLQNEFNLIQEGDKTKRLFLIEPNPFRSNIVAYIDDRFVQHLKDYVDYDTNFDKSFMSPLKIMVEALSWDIEKKTETLDDW